MEMKILISKMFLENLKLSFVQILVKKGEVLENKIRNRSDFAVFHRYTVVMQGSLINITMDMICKSYHDLEHLCVCAREPTCKHMM